MMEDDRSGTCATQLKEDKCIPEGKDHLKTYAKGKNITYFFVAQNERGDASGIGALAGSCVHVNEPSVFIKRGELLTIKILAFDSQDVLCPMCLVGTPLIEVQY
jgi:hypothetical protein